MRKSEFSAWEAGKKMTIRTKPHRCKLIVYRILCNEKFKAQVSNTGR